MKEFADRGWGEMTRHNVVDRVWLATQDLCQKQGSHKLNPKYIDPYQIHWRINKVTY